MDLGTVQHKLFSGQYRAPIDFISDVNLIFKNAKAYNPRNSEVNF